MRLYRFNDRYETQRELILYKLNSIDTTFLSSSCGIQIPFWLINDDWLI